MNAIVRWVICRKLRQATKDITEGKVKSGIKSSEFWVIIVTGIVTTITKALNLDPQIADALLKLAIAYLAGRSVIKVGEVVANGKTGKK